jgi:hypothetical protein
VCEQLIWLLRPLLLLLLPLTLLLLLLLLPLLPLLLPLLLCACSPCSARCVSSSSGCILASRACASSASYMSNKSYSSPARTTHQMTTDQKASDSAAQRPQTVSTPNVQSGKLQLLDSGVQLLQNACMLLLHASSANEPTS